LNWLKDKLKEWFSEPQPLQPQKSGTLATRYGGNLQDPNALVHRANKRATGGDVEGAFADFQEAIQLSPTRATAYYNRGFLHNTLGNFEAAIEDFNRALELLPDYDEAFYQRGNSYLQIKEPSNAIQDFSRAIAQNPYSIKAYYKRAEAYAEMGDTAGALSDYAQAITRVPKDANAYYQRGRYLSKMGEMQAAIADFTTAIGFNPRHADAFCSRGCCFAELGDIESANLDFNQALLHNPSHQAAYYQRMYSLGILKDTAANFQDLNRVFAPSPPTSGTHQPPVVISAELVEPSSPSLTNSFESPEVQQEELQQGTVKLEPEGIAGYFERATKRAMNGDLDGAIADYTQIIDQDPHNTQAYYRRGQNYSAIGEDKAALEDLNQAIHWARIHSLGQLKDFSGALEETIQTLKTELQKPKPSNVSAAASGMTIEGAIADYTHTLETNPSADVYFKRAQSRALMGDLQGAIADYSETIRLNPAHPEAYYRRGLHRSALGDTVGATQDLNQTILRKPIQSEEPTLPGSNGPPTMSGKTRPPASAAAVNLNPSHYCNHAGNRSGNRFCIHCGEVLEPKVTHGSFSPQLPSARAASGAGESSFSDGDRLLQRGRSRCASGNLTDGLDDLGNALKVFLKQQNMGRYQETLKLIQQFSQNL
jgi:tetratricopeptide (TPR) repeat protein